MNRDFPSKNYYDYSDNSLEEKEDDTAINIRNIEEELEFQNIYSKKHKNNCSVRPKEAWNMLHKVEIGLIDVRLEEEATYAGYPDLDKFNKATVLIPYSTYPLAKQETNFFERYDATFINPNTHNIFICSNGSKSKQLVESMIETHPNCTYIEGGFSGPLNPETKKRGEIEGWRAAGLPWANY